MIEGCNLIKMFDIIQFWVGLMEGDGSIQVNHWRKKNLAYRLVIKLKNTLANEKMLKTISKNIGGRVRISSSKEDVLWVEDNKNHIIEIIKIFEKYPPLTARKFCQLEFLKSCLKHNNVELYLKERDFKYSSAENFLFKSYRDLPFYFPSWLSGFIEAEGCFSTTAKNKKSFSIAQKYEKDLILTIKNYFIADGNIILVRDNDLYEIKIYNHLSLLKIFSHCLDFPLLGEKKLSLDKFKENFKF